MAWPLIVADFASEYGISLDRDEVTFAEFRPLVAGLLQANTRIWRLLTPKDKRPGR